MKYRLLFLFVLFIAAFQAQAAEIAVSVESVDFGDVEVGYPVTTTFNLTGINLTDDINLTVLGRKSDFYTVTPQAITPQDAASGVTVTVKCSPVSQYISPANVVLTSLNAEDVIIPINVSPYYPTEMFLSNQAQQFTAQVGQIIARSGAIRFADAIAIDHGNHWFADAEVPHDPNTPVVRSNGSTLSLGSSWLSTDYSLSIEGADSNHFSARIVKSSSITNICTVNIVYSPRSTGTHAATLKVTCSKAGVPVVTIPLQGESTGILCDLDDNGLLNVSDVTSMIHLVLSSSDDPTHGDFDGDGRCNVTDVTKLISYLLGL